MDKVNIVNFAVLIKYLAFFALGCLVATWFKGCVNSVKTPEVIEVNIPETRGVIKAKKVINTPVIIQAIRKDINSSINEKLILENKQLRLAFEKVNDSLKSKMFNEATTLNNFSANFEDDNITIDVNGVAQGQVKEVNSVYTIKKKTIDVPIKIKESVLRVLVGGSVGLNTELNKAAYQLDLNLQNRKGNIISIEHIKIGEQTFWMGGYKYSILNIKR